MYLGHRPDGMKEWMGPGWYIKTPFGVKGPYVTVHIATYWRTMAEGLND